MKNSVCYGKSCLLLMLFLLFTSTAIAATIELPKTGQTTSYAARDDGDFQQGVSWPSPRFVDNGDGTVTDKLTGLIWLKNANCFGSRTWAQALSDSNNLASGQCGLSDGSHLGDWRLPNVNELQSPVKAQQSDIAAWLNSSGFSNVQSDSYWSSNTYMPVNVIYSVRAVYAPALNMSNGFVTPMDKIDNLYVWPVRGGQAGAVDPSYPANVWKTGQTTCYDSAGVVIACAGTGQDGEKQAGVSWPSPRFTDNGNGTVTDNLTGLIWLRNAKCFGFLQTWRQALSDSSNLASGQCGLTDGSHAGDWRLPNRVELYSLSDFSQDNMPLLPSGHPFDLWFGSPVDLLVYWSSTTYQPDTTNGAWLFDPGSGRVGGSAKAFNAFLVWPVRVSLQNTYTVSGYVTANGSGLKGVSMNGLRGTPVTDDKGFYSAMVTSGWSGAVTPAKFGYVFQPQLRTYIDVKSDQNDQDYTAEAVPCVEPPAGLISWWPGDGNANDIIGGNDGWRQPGAPFAVIGTDEQAFSFEGMNDLVSVPDNTSLDIAGAFTIDAFVNPIVAQPPGAGIVMKMNTSGTSPVYGLFFDAEDRVRVQIFTDEVGVFSPAPTAPLPVNRWSHVAGTYDGLTLRTFLDGVEQSSLNVFGSGILQNNDNPLLIGYSGSNFEVSFSGLIDEVALYNRALSAEEVRAISNAHKCKYSCSYSLFPASHSFGSSGGTGSVSVAAANGCSWAAASSEPWITIASGGSGSGAGTVGYHVSPNATGTSRTGTLTVRGHTFTVRQAAVTFADVGEGYWAYPFIYRIFFEGITGGCGNGNFCPDNPVTRSQMAVFLLAAMGETPAASCSGLFGDVSAATVGDVVCRLIEKFSTLGITGGCGNGNFCPNDPVTREQMAVFMTTALSRAPSGVCNGIFNDVNAGTVGDGFCRYIEKFATLGITGGCGNGNYCPNDPVTRAQMAVFLTTGFLQ